jgi:glyoxylase-like metal-dependent hydrolase (beta-lactamase superfamily II)
VRHIVPTHLDLDHVGGLADFPEATVHVFAPEHDAAMKRATQPERHRYRPVQWAHGAKWQVHEVAGESWLGFESVRVLGPDLVLVPLVGHTRGHCAVAVRDDSGWLLHAGDAYFFHGEMDAEKPHCTPGLAFFQKIIAFDDRARTTNRDRLRALVSAHANDLRVFCAHDPAELDAMVTASAEARRAMNGNGAIHAR